MRNLFGLFILALFGFLFLSSNTTLAQESFPFDPSKVWYDPSSNHLCHEDDFTKTVLCEEKGLGCTYDSSKDSWLCKTEMMWDPSFATTYLVFNFDLLNGRYLICLPCITVSTCGDGVYQSSEECDPSVPSTIPFGHYCDATCHLFPLPSQTCGDGNLDVEEECDDGNQVSGDGCTFDCKIQECGNGIIEPYETCDDGNSISGDGCSDRCVIECTLGDFTGSSYHCPPTCGNGVFERGEGCDDGNLISNDGCSATCQPDEPPDPDLVTCYACGPGGCLAMSGTLEFCALFFAEAACGGTCGSDPEPEPECGNGTPEAGEECDDGNTLEGDGCNSSCDEENLCYTCGVAGGCLSIFADETTCSSLFSDPLCSGTCEEGATTTVPPTDADIALCEDPSTIPPDHRLRDFGDSTHISRCETETSVRYLICGDEGDVTVNIMECETGDPCVAGACIDTFDPVDPFCVDLEPTDDVHVQGEVVGVDAFGDGYATADSCTGVALAGGTTSTREYICNADGTRGEVIIACPEGEHCDYAAGACVSSCTRTTCSRTEATATEAGFVTGIDCVVQHDICDGSNRIVFACGADEMPAVSETIACPAGCLDGLCL